MVGVRVYVEGGGDTVAQAKPLREALATWIQQAVPEATRQPRVIACGGRGSAFEEFCLGVKANPAAFNILLVDSEAPLAEGAKRWAHVAARQGDGWETPAGIGEDNLHFMAQAMESWLCADPDALERYFGDGFKAAKLPRRKNLEEEPKADLSEKLDAATRPSRRGPYRKGAHLDLLGHTKPALVIARCPHAGVFVDVLRARLAGG